MDCAEESERIVNTLEMLIDISEAEKGIMNLKSESTGYRFAGKRCG